MDYYKILGVSPDADLATIKSRYRKLAKEYHPDLHPGDAGAAEKFTQINEAWENLGDSGKRAKYDASRVKVENKQTAAKGKRTVPVSEANYADLMGRFDSFFGKAFQDKSGKDGKQQQNPLDASELFEKYIGIKRK